MAFRCVPAEFKHWFRMLEEWNCHKSSKRVWGRGLEGNVLFDEVKWKLYAL